ncbi:MAG: ChpI protein [Rhodanobacter sp.]|nr:MAG: ChpI protein [Rhodanobacter sp.]TAM03867.1 MAG: ChpI protein [Rhodanobacter sp.]TAM43236.1 MAG: ChpI protein [Rhodanobacter sp.]TAN28893.1 MAG: ChpI protein [Rhodanobacter sp.]
MKVAISVPDPVFDAAERLAKERRVPRSQVFSEALVEYVAKYDSSAVTAKLNVIYDEAASKVAPAFLSAQYALLSHEAW